MDKLSKDIIEYGRDKKWDCLEQLIKNETNDTVINRLIDAIKNDIDKDGGNTVWNYILLNFSNSKNYNKKRFQIVKAVLLHLNTIDLSVKQTVCLITRLYRDLPKFSSDDLIELVEYCLDSMRSNNQNCFVWKDLLPEIMTHLSTTSLLIVNGIHTTGEEYRKDCIRSIYTMKWSEKILTPLADMFRLMPLLDNERIIVLQKICKCLQSMRPKDLPPLAHQLFELSNAKLSFLIIPILSLHKYFHKNYYKTLWTELDSGTTNGSFDSMESFSNEDIRESERTIIYHLNKSTEYTIHEKDIVNYLRGLAATPQYILTPFMLSVLITLSDVNRYPEICKFSSSQILPFLRNVVQNNELEKNLCKKSKWCRDVIDRKNIDMIKILEVLIDNSKNDKNDIYTYGIVQFGYALLKTPSKPEFHWLAIKFLQIFIKKHSIFGPGIFKDLVDFLFADQESLQICECLIRVSRDEWLMMSECTEIIQHILDYFLLIPGNVAIRIMPFLLNIVKYSIKVRDMLIDMLRQAMDASDPATRRMGVYGFCSILKKLNQNNSQQSGQPTTLHSFTSSQFPLSGYSMMSQSSINTQIPKKQRQFHILALEIIGMLQKCFNETSEIKEIMYKDLTNVIASNHKITPHIIQFLDSHFRGYFDVSETDTNIHFNMIIREDINGRIEIWDNLGKLTQLMSYAIIKCEKYKLCDTPILTSFFQNILKSINNNDLEKHGLVLNTTLDQRTYHIATQYLNFLEALMDYVVWSANNENDNINICLKLYEYHENVLNKVKLAVETLKKLKKGKKADATPTTQISIDTTNSVQQSIKSISFQPENILNIPTLQHILHIIFDDGLLYSTDDQITNMQSNAGFCQYILRTLCYKIEMLRSKINDYQNFHISKTAFDNVHDVMGVVYEKCIKDLPDICTNFNFTTAYLCIECFHQCLLTWDALFKRKSLDSNDNDGTVSSVRMISNLQSIILQLIRNNENENLNEEAEKIIVCCLECIEKLYENVTADSSELSRFFMWTFELCQNFDIKTKDMGIIHRLLFTQNLQINSGNFFETIAIQIEDISTPILEIPIEKTQFKLKSINPITLDSCVIYLCNTMRQKIENIEYFITKARSFHAKINISTPDLSENCIITMKSTEKKINQQLIHIANVMIHMANSSLKLGQCMDSVIRVLIQLYVCLTNMTKHLTLRHSILPVIYSENGFDKVVRITGRPLAARIYDLLEYIEQNIFESDGTSRSRRKNPTADKQRVLRESKYLPKLIFRIENYNKFIILLSKKIKSDLSEYLHYGTVRDFRIKSSILEEVINKTNDSNSDDDSNDDDSNNEEKDSNSKCEGDSNSSCSSELARPLTLSTEPSNSISNIDITDQAIALQNLAKINERTKRKLKNKINDPGTTKLKRKNNQ